MLHLKLQTWNRFGIWHFLHPHKHITGIKCRVLKFGYSNAVLVVPLDTPKSTATLKKMKSNFHPHIPLLSSLQLWDPPKNRLKKRRRKAQDLLPAVCQPPVFHRSSLQLMAFPRKLQLTLITLTWQHSLLAPKASAPSLCYLRKLSRSLWDKTCSGPRADSNPCQLNSPAVGCSWMLKGRVCNPLCSPGSKGSP